MVVLEKTLGSPLDCKEIWPVHPKRNQSLVFIGRTDAEAENSNTEVTWYKELTHWKRPWCWERLKAGGEGDNRECDGWMVSPTQWKWVWESSAGWWWTGKPGVLQSVGWKGVRQAWATELNQLKESRRSHMLQLRLGISSVQFSCSVISDFLQPHGLQHARLPCPSSTPRACANSCPLSQWCHPTISSSVVPFSSCL